MSEIVLETKINAPPAICFGLIRDRRIQAEPLPIVTGDFGLGQTVVFASMRFGLLQRLTVRVVEFEPPHLLVDEITKGNFRSFKHIHEFAAESGGTLMRDRVVWTLPFGTLGKLANKLLIERYLRNLVNTRNKKLKQIAEG